MCLCVGGVRDCEGGGRGAEQDGKKREVSVSRIAWSIPITG